MKGSLGLLSPGVVLQRYVLAAAKGGERRVVAWAECMSDRDSLLLVEEWFAYCESVTKLADGWYWWVGIEGDVKKRSEPVKELQP